MMGAFEFQYGEDSLSIEKTPFLNEKQFSFLAENSQIIRSNTDECSEILLKCRDKKLKKEAEKNKKWKKKLQSKIDNWTTIKLNDDVSLFRTSPFIEFSRDLLNDKEISTKSLQERVKIISEAWRTLDEETKHSYEKSCPANCRLPITANYPPDRYLGAISEKLDQLIDNYLYKNGFKNIAGLDSDQFKDLIHLKHIRSCITPGDSVGILAAQSIGEPSTQMTLNTFHFAGRGDMNVTLGIPRLREILMVASNQIKTPSMQVPIRDQKLPQAEQLKSHFTRTLLWDCFKSVEVEQTLDLNYHKGSNPRVWLTNVRVEFISQHELTYGLGSPLKLDELIGYFESKFVKNLCIGINKKYNQIDSSGLLFASSVRDKSMRNFRNINGSDEDGGAIDEGLGDGENDDNEDLVRDLDTGDSIGDKMQAKVNDELEYEEEEEDGSDHDDDHEGNDGNDKPSQNVESEDDLIEDIKEIDLNGSHGLSKKNKKMSKSRVKRVLGISDLVAEYSYDYENGRWCSVVFKLDAHKPRLNLYSVIQKAAQNSYISKVSGIKRCFLNQSTLPEDKGCFKLTTEGINVEEVIKNSDVFDASRLYLNDIHLMASKFGIEAASKVLINEIKQVFGMYGIQVDYRHLSLIADYMTFEGAYKPFNRIGIKPNASPLQKMSFETCMQFFKDAFLFNQHEDLKSPSACLVAGRLVNVGAGLCDVLTKLNP